MTKEEFAKILREKRGWLHITCDTYGDMLAGWGTTIHDVAAKAGRVVKLSAGLAGAPDEFVFIPARDVGIVGEGN